MLGEGSQGVQRQENENYDGCSCVVNLSDPARLRHLGADIYILGVYNTSLRLRAVCCIHASPGSCSRPIYIFYSSNSALTNGRSGQQHTDENVFLFAV